MRTAALELDPVLGWDLGRALLGEDALVRPDSGGPSGLSDGGRLDDGSLARDGAANRSGTAPGELGDPAPAVAGEGLVIPTLSPEIPSILTIRGGGEERGAALARAMLAEGILQERDWQGDIVLSIATGLTRWVGEILSPGDPGALAGMPPGDIAAADLQRIDIGIFWTDAVEAVSGIDTRLWREAHGANPKEPVGVLALQSEPTEDDRYPAERDCIVGRTVLEAEEARPGLGWQLLILLQDILPVVLCTATPHWAYQQVVKAHAAAQVFGRAGRIRMDDRDLVFPEHCISPKAFLEVVPPQALTGEARHGVIKEALRHLDELPEHLRDTVVLANEALKLSQVPRETYRWDTHSLCAQRGLMFIDIPGGAAVESPFTIRWSEDDLMPVIVDDFHHQVRRGGESTNLIWSRGFQCADPKSTAKAVRDFRRIVPLALKACQLAEAMHQDGFPVAPTEGQSE